MNRMNNMRNNLKKFESAYPKLPNELSPVQMCRRLSEIDTQIAKLQEESKQIAMRFSTIFITTCLEDMTANKESETAEFSFERHPAVVKLFYNMFYEGLVAEGLKRESEGRKKIIEEYEQSLPTQASVAG
jgi:hypothetical protein